jgi:hypothetical protein
MKLELENGSSIETIDTNEPIVRSKRGQEQLDNLHNIGLKEIKFCKYCGSKNIIQSTGYYKHYNCLECGTQRID